MKTDSMNKYFLSQFNELIPHIELPVVKAICKYRGIKEFYGVKNITEIDKKVIKGVPGCYMFIDTFFGQIKYVGESKDLANRLKQSHSQYDNESIVIIPCISYTKACQLERAFIGVFQPYKNKEKGRTKRR